MLTGFRREEHIQRILEDEMLTGIFGPNQINFTNFMAI
jgi:hypothetical protein